mgnify:CR=1 FL=1
MIDDVVKTLRYLNRYISHIVLYYKYFRIYSYAILHYVRYKEYNIM